MDLLPQLRSVLDSAGYAAETIAERLGIDSNLTIRTADVPVHLRKLHHRDALDTFIRLFLLRATVTAEEAMAALAPLALDDLQEAGLLRREDSAVRALLRLAPYDGLVFAYDAHEPSELGQDSVLGWTSSARTLASVTVRRRVERALDVGTGCGSQALLAARHADQVVAVDLNPRALWLTELNSRLNGVSNVESRQGDLFEPVEGETFDLVVSNPPFVISPSSDYLFRDGGLEGDQLSKAAVLGAAAVLRDGGFAHVMCNWIARPSGPWWNRPSAWIENCGCDALLLHYDTLGPLRYAQAWNDHLRSDRQRFAEALDSWLEYYRSRGIEAIGMGAVILRRRADGRQPWVQTAELAQGPSGSSGRQVERLFAAQDDPASADDEILLAGVFRPVDGHRLQQVLTYRRGAYTAEDAVILLDNGLGLRNRVPPQALHVLLRMDGARSVRELVAETAEETGLDGDALCSSAVRCLRHLFRLGLLERAS